ncbi:MAG: hypothetical protein ACK50A_11640 [Sphingobacteriaceae bacterium]|jgi:hypothetical protein
MRVLIVGLLRLEVISITKTLPEVKFDVLRDKIINDIDVSVYQYLIIDPFAIDKKVMENIKSKLKEGIHTRVIIVSTLKLNEVNELEIRLTKYVSKPYLLDEIIKHIN